MNAQEFFSTRERNLMTPDPVQYLTTDHHYIEVASGSGVFGGYVFGVTVYKTNGTHLPLLCRSFGDVHEAQGYAMDVARS
jgi:hypothetical protein